MQEVPVYQALGCEAVRFNDFPARNYSHQNDYRDRTLNAIFHFIRSRSPLVVLLLMCVPTGMRGAVAPELSALSCHSSSIIGSGTDVCTMIISAAAADGGFKVSMTSNDASFKVPEVVTVPAKASSVTFIAAVTAVKTAQTATVTAREGSVTKTYGVKLIPETPFLRLSANELNFGDVAINQTSNPQYLTLTSAGNVPLKISSIAMTGTGITISEPLLSPVTLNPGQTIMKKLLFHPEHAGMATGQLTIVSTSVDTPKAVINVIGRGRGIPELIGLSCANKTLVGTTSDICTVTLISAAVTGGVSISLASNDPSVKVPTTVTVPENASSAQFTVAASYVTAAQTATLTARSGNVSRTYGLTLDAATPTLQVSTTSLAFGNVAVTTAATPQVVTLSSTGTAPVTVTADTLTGTGFAVSGTSLPVTLNPGQTAALDVQFSPTVSGPVSGQLLLKSTSSSSPSTAITLSGTGVPEVTGLNCSASSLIGAGTDSCTVTINAAASTGGLAIAVSSADAAVKVPATVTVPANASSVGFTATASAVTSTQAATLTASAGGVSKTFTLQLNAPVPTLSISATSLSFGSTTVNTAAAPQSVILRSTGTGPVTVNSASVTGAAFSISGGNFPVTLSPGQSTTISVQFDPTTTGAATGQLAINSTSSTNPSALVSLSGTGAAVSGILTTLSCTSGSITGSGSDVCTVGLNAPSASGAVTVSLSSSNSAVVVPATVTVPANASSVGFTATVSAVTSAQAATLTASVGGVSETFALQLAAAVPTLSINLTNILFGDVTLNSPSTQSLTLSSTGSAPVTVNSATLTGTGFTLTGATFPVTLNPSQLVTLSIQFDPTSAGTATGQLSISSNSTTNSSAVVSLSGTGIAQSYSVNLSWDAPSSTPVPIVGYNIYRALSGSSSYELLNSSPDAQTSYTDTTVVVGQTYDYYVESVDNSGGTSGPSNTYGVIVP